VLQAEQQNRYPQSNWLQKLFLGLQWILARVQSIMNRHPPTASAPFRLAFAPARLLMVC
jgi:hypothetical protein